MNLATKDRIAKICAEAYHGSRPNLEAAILLALKEQDRNTRHACAEAVTLAMNMSPENTTLSGFGPVAQQALYNLSSLAHQACMNVQAL